MRLEHAPAILTYSLHSVLTRPEHLEAFFYDSHKHLKAPNNNSGYVFGELLGQCVGLISGTAWQTLRQATQKPFAHNAVVAESNLEMITHRVNTYMTNLQGADGRLQHGHLHTAEDLKLLPFLIIAEMFYGPLTPAMSATLSDLVPLRERLMKHAFAGGVNRWSWSRFLPTQASADLTTWKAKWRNFNTEAYERARELSPQPPIVQLWTAVEVGTFPLAQVLQTIDEALFANLDVTTGAISWIPAYLAAHQDVQARLLDEMSASAHDKHSLLVRSDTFLSACILESSRLKPVIPFTIPQAAPTDRIIGEYVIPAGTSAVVDTHALNVRNEYWGEDRASFWPERFMHQDMTKLRYRFWRFGFGPRQCMGKHVADVVVRAVVIRLLRGWKIELAEKAEQWEWGRNGQVWITQPDFLVRCTPRAEPTNDLLP